MLKHLVYHNKIIYCHSVYEVIRCMSYTGDCGKGFAFGIGWKRYPVIVQIEWRFRVV